MVLRLSDIPDPTSAMREHVLRLRAWANHEVDPSEYLRRGAVYKYRFNEPRVQSGELWKFRPVLVMNENPAWCKRMKRILSVIPLSSGEDSNHDDSRSLPITINGEVSYAVLSQATTINSARISEENYVGQLDDEQLSKVSKLLRHNLLGDFTAPQTADVLPGNVFEVSWHDKDHRRPFCVLTDLHIKDPSYPVVSAVPLTEVDLRDEFQANVKPRPLSIERFTGGDANFICSLPPEIFERLRTRAARQFGL